MKTKTIVDGKNSGGFESMCWTKTAPPPPETPTLSGQVDADVAVVGGGYTGLSTALHLAEAGKSTVLLEAEEIGWGASGRNGGIVFASWLNVPPEKAISRFGPEQGERMNRMMVSAAKLVPHLIEKHAMDCDFRKTGMLGVAETKKQIFKMHSLAEQWERYGVKADHIPSQRLSDYIATDKYAEGVLYPESGHLNPLGYARGLARAAQSAGASLYTHSPATNIEQQGERWKVSSSDW